MPVFIRATARQAIGFKGASIQDPLFGPVLAQAGLPGLSFNGAPDRAMPAPPHQMAEKFGVEGVDFVKDYVNVLFCPLFDADCDATCTESATCQPPVMTGFTRKVPANAWGSHGSFPEYSQVGQTASIFDSLTGLTLTLRSRGRQTRAVGDGSQLDFVPWQLAALPKRTENCAGDPAKGQQGIDCNAPLGQITVPLVPGLYSGWVYFGRDHMLEADFEALQGGQITVPYDPAERVTIERCEGNSWCDGEHSGFRMETEPETGAIISTHLHFQTSMRIGMQPTLLHPAGFNDAVVPVLSLEVQAGASSKIEGKLAQLQGMPGQLNLFVILTIVFNTLLVLMHAGCALRYFLKAKAADNTVEVLPRATPQTTSLPSMLTSQGAAGQQGKPATSGP